MCREAGCRSTEGSADAATDRHQGPAACTPRSAHRGRPSVDGGHRAHALDGPGVHNHCKQVYLAVIRQRIRHADGADIVDIAAASTADVGVDDQPHRRRYDCELSREHLDWSRARLRRPDCRSCSPSGRRMSAGSTLGATRARRLGEEFSWEVKAEQRLHLRIAPQGAPASSSAASASCRCPGPSAPVVLITFYYESTLDNGSKAAASLRELLRERRLEQRDVRGVQVRAVEREAVGERLAVGREELV